MEEFWNAQAEWSQSVFGSDEVRGPQGPLKHLVKEIEKELLPEIQKGETKGDLVEYVDLQFLIFDAVRRAGYTYQQLLDSCFDKLDKNKAREWPHPDAWKFGEPHFVDSEDCMGNPEKYWRVWAQREYQQICGVGLTKEQAMEDCRKKINELPVEHVRKES